MKRILVLIFTAFFALSSQAFGAMKNDTNIKFSLWPVNKDAEDNYTFGGSYARVESVMSDDFVTLGGKIYYRVKGSNSTTSASQEVELKRAYVKIRPFGNNLAEFAVGKLYSYYLAGSYFSLMEIYTGASRWGKTGIGFKSEFNGFTLGLALPAMETNSAAKKANKEYNFFRTDWGMNASLSYNFAELSDSLPITFGANLLYSASGKGASDGSSDGEADVNSVSEKDFSECFSAYYYTKNLWIFSRFSTFFAFSHNAVPYVANSSFRPVANYSNADLKRVNLFSLAVKAYFDNFRVVLEGEGGHSVDGTMIPFYTALQFKLPLYEGLSLQPIFSYFASYDTSDSKNSFDTWLIYPQLVLEYKRLTLTAGWHGAYMEVKDDDYRWLWYLPLSARIKIGG